MTWEVDSDVGLPVLSFVAANMRDMDWKEIRCQLPEERRGMAAEIVFYAGGPHRYAGVLNGCPVAVWGMFELRPGLWTAWAYGTDRLGRVAPLISKHIFETVVPDILARGARRVEVRSLKGHSHVDGWLSRMGGVLECEMPDYGANGETFNLWAWRKSDL